MADSSNNPQNPIWGASAAGVVSTPVPRSLGAAAATAAATAVAIPLPDFDERLDEAVAGSARYLLSLQEAEGFWLGELEADSTLESDYIFYLHILGKFEPTRVAKLANYVRRKQLPDGGWNIYQGGPSELNATVKAYFALKLAGDSPDSAHMESARLKVHDLGGLEKSNSFTRFYLAMVGAVGWELVPAIPPELMLLPTWFYVNVYEMSSWTRAIVVPLTILYAQKPQWPLPQECRVDELFLHPEKKDTAFAWDRDLFTWKNFFLSIDFAFKLYERLPWKPLRERALRQAQEWLLDHLDRSDGLGAIYPAMMNSVFALMAMGHSPDDPVTAREVGELARFEIEEHDSIRLQPCLSPVWDTAIAIVALAESGMPPDHPAMVKAAKWLLDKQIFSPGDWQIKNKKTQPGGWAFEFRNDFYPDVDDTAFVLMALQRVDYPDKPKMERAVRRGLSWMLSMQNRDGGWGAFDRDNDCAILTQVPFADHNAMIDPSTGDVTARVVECLGRFGWPASHPVMKRAISFLMRDQCPDGSWYGRWGVNYVYGTGGVLRALEAVKLMAREYCQRGAAWLRAVQNSDGGWGETLASYNDPKLKGKGSSTPSQTAWGLIGLLAAGPANHTSVRRAVEHLVDQQNPDGSWSESAYTGTGFPCVFYLKYHLYKNYFPLYALARYRNIQQGVTEFHGIEVRPREFERRNGARES
ncbi:MAG: squalene--hopene cyclase [Acidobacteria bacterium]|nr:squalene--hopene cyclase [Acidobacteriota bacterium]